MSRTSRERTYRDCTVAGASPIGLLVALFDRLAADLRRAAEAIRAGDIEARCREINHGLLILGQLEDWVDLQNGGEPARQISALYAQWRVAMVQASIHMDAAILDSQVATILHIRSRWQEIDTNGGDLGLEANAVIAAANTSYTERSSLSLSA